MFHAGRASERPDYGIDGLLDFWQIFGKRVFLMRNPLEGKVRIAAYILVI